jgi:RNA polymerase sigma factor (sigma-70 family)
MSTPERPAEELIEDFYAACDAWPPVRDAMIRAVLRAVREPGPDRLADTRARRLDEALARRNRDACFDALVRVVRPGLLRSVERELRIHWVKYRSVSGPREWPAIEDGAHDATDFALVKLLRDAHKKKTRWERSEAEDRGSTVESWLTTVALNAYIDDKRSEKKHLRRREGTGYDAAASAVDPAPSPIDRAIEAERSRLAAEVRLAAGSLPPTEKAVIEGLDRGESQKDIALRLGVSQATIVRIKQRAFESLRQMFGDLF